MDTTLKRTDLKTYQKRAIHFALNNKFKFLMLLDMGMGKTATNLTIFERLYYGLKVDKCIVIAPLGVANGVWAQECKKWEHLKHFKVAIATGSEKQRRAAILSNPDILVINRENLPWLVSKYKWIWDMCIIDESSSFRSFKSKRFKAIKHVLDRIKVMIPSTGTPSPKGMTNLWSQVYLVDKGERLGRHITQFRGKYFKPSGYMGYGFDLLKGCDNEIMDKIKDVSISMRSSDYLSLPDKIILFREIEFDKDLKEKYDELKKTSIMELESGETITGLSAAAVVGKLCQFTNGAIYDSEEGVKVKKWHEIHTLKIDELKQIIEDNENENILVAYNFRHDLERLKKEFPKAIVLDTNSKTIDKWNNGEIKLLLAHPASAGYGLNLQHGGSMIVWFGLTWDLELYQQFNARLFRQGQQKPVRIIHLIVKDTVDENIIESLSSKDKVQENLLNYLKFKVTKM